MSDQPENIMLVYLRRIDANVAELRAEVRDVKQRVTNLEIQSGQTNSTMLVQYAALMQRLDRIDDRVERVERRLDLLPA